MLITSEPAKNKLIKFKKSKLSADMFDLFRDAISKHDVFQDGFDYQCPEANWFVFKKHLQDLGFMIHEKPKARTPKQELIDLGDPFDREHARLQKIIPPEHELDFLNSRRTMKKLLIKNGFEDKATRTQESITRTEKWRKERGFPLQGQGV